MHSYLLNQTFRIIDINSLLLVTRLLKAGQLINELLLPDNFAILTFDCDLSCSLWWVSCCTVDGMSMIILGELIVFIDIPGATARSAKGSFAAVKDRFE